MSDPRELFWGQPCYRYINLPNGWGRWDRTTASGSQGPEPYHLAISQYNWSEMSDLNGRDTMKRPLVFKTSWLNHAPTISDGSGNWIRTNASQVQGLEPYQLGYAGIWLELSELN